MIHISGSFPWGYSIVTATLLFRGCLTLPLAVLQRRNQERMVLVRPLSKAWAKTLEKAPPKSAVSAKAGELTLQKKAAQARLGQRIRHLHQQLSCSSIRNIWLPLLQIPLFISMTAAIRQLLGVQFLWIEASGEPMNGMRDEGFAWFPDLVASDPTLITPIICGLCYLFNTESAAANRRDVGNLKKQTSAILKGLQRLLAFLMGIVATQAPMGIVLFWTTSAAFSAVQNLFFNYYLFSPSKSAALHSMPTL